MSTAPYVALATALDRVHQAIAERKAARRVHADMVHLDRAMVSAGLGHVALVVPAEYDRPDDLDDCSSCEGQGLVEVVDWMTGGGMVDVTCPRCGGTGERGAA